ncbi:hypothetical protein AJ80_08318 [Polytolypa hystricis UAMH7299]|uniref:GRIP domain-containing protein n=1 Tax=Polytolypa hystricis (strain UAMH7299) TaxID=1447883 RepID=A0A2B7X966_POLH7|nr:hypothetical protein AJ80_08318 [Polytolypa hystricis UAMH7299]
MPADTSSSAPPQGSKSKRRNKKKNAAKAKAEEAHEVNESAHAEGSDQEEQAAQEASTTAPDHSQPNGAPPEQAADLEESKDGGDKARSSPTTNKTSREDERPITITERSPDLQSDDRFEALVRDRDSLRAEVTEMRRSLEQIQSKHDEEMGDLQKKLEASRNEKEHAEARFRDLLGKVNTIKSQLGERLKADAEELAQTRSRIEDLENENASLKGEVEAKSATITSLQKEDEERSKELSSLRNRTNLSQQNWIKERQELVEREAETRVEFEEAKQAMHSWEILAMEERSHRETHAERVIDLEEQLSNVKADYEKAAEEANTQTLTVDGLQRALQEIQTARKQELRELVESSDAQIEELRKKVQEAETTATEANTKLEVAEQELKRALPFEKEVKEKNLLIGKLRHEAVTLNEHLTKALRFLKKGKPEDNVDRQLVTNHVLHFLALDRSDPKKFQILQLIAALLGWNDEQRQQAGLARPGTSAGFSSLRLPGSPVHRTPSTPSLSTDFFTDMNSSRKESLAELWSNFLEQEAQAGAARKESRSGSQSTSHTSPP